MIVDEQRLAIFVEQVRPYSMQNKVDITRYWRRRVEEAKVDDKLGYKPVGHRRTIWY